MTLSKRPYKGTRDFFPAKKRAQDYIFNQMKITANLFGFEPYDGPMIEEVELYKAKSGEELINDQIYSFHDRGDRFVAIRPEMTPTLARMVAQIHRETPKPIRWYSIPNLMRYEKPQKGRLREHWQFNCDIFGAPGRMGEIEILQIAIKLLNQFGANSSHFEILINDRAIVDTTFKEIMKLDEEQSTKLYKIVDKAKKVPADAIKEMIDKLNIGEDNNKIFFEYFNLKNFDEALTFLKKHKQIEAGEKLAELLTPLKELELLEYIKFDSCIVRGLDYYTGIVFEIFDKHPENRRAICGGGAYANLLKIFNEPPLTGVGFGLGDVTLTDFLTTHKLLPDFTTPENDLFLSFQDAKCAMSAFKLATQLREKGIKVIAHLEPIKFNKVFQQAEKKGARFVSLMGDREFESGTIEIKELKSKEQHSFSLDSPDEIIQLLSK